MSKFSEKLGGGLGCLLGLAMMGYGIAIVIVGAVGINVEYGFWWSVVALCLFFWLRFTIPLAYGAILGAMHLWDWHWIGATLFAMPGLLFMIPALVSALIGLVMRR